MATYLLDTNIIIDVVNGKKGRDELLKELVRQGNLLACCPINVAEVFAGMRPKEEALTTALLRSLVLYPISFAVAGQAGLFKRDYGKKGITLALPDALLAAVAIHNQLTLITENIRHFPMKELSIHPLTD